MRTQQNQPLTPLFGLALAAAAAFALTGCKESTAQAQTQPGGPARPVEVGVVTVSAEPVTLQRELPGRTAPFRIAEVRARVDGIVLERLFEEGADVKQGQPLFRIDALPYQAALQSAQAQLARAEANAENNKAVAERYAALLADRAVSRQEHDTAMAAQRASAAEVAAGKAAVQVARINLGYTRVTSPIHGRIGRSEVTEGAFARQGQATLLATVQQLDPIYVDVTQSSAELLRLRQELESGNLVRSGEGAQVRLMLEDGSLYGPVGTLQFSDVTVNRSTGSVTLRALFPNPDGTLLPGMFVRAKLEEGTRPQALMIPQPAVRRDAQGKASVLVVEDGKVAVRPIVAPRAVGNRWLVTDGLAEGDQVIIEGLQKVRPGAAVTTVPAKFEALPGTSSTPRPEGGR